MLCVDLLFHVLLFALMHHCKSNNCAEECGMMEKESANQLVIALLALYNSIFQPGLRVTLGFR